MTIAERLRARMKALDLGQAETARRANMSPQRLNNYLQGRRPDAAAIAALAAALNTDIPSLTGINDEMIEALEPILVRLFELEAMPPARATVLARLAAAALRLRTALQDEGDARGASRTAAQAVWVQHNEQEPG